MIITIKLARLDRARQRSDSGPLKKQKQFVLICIVIFIRGVKTLSTLIQTQVKDIHRHKVTDSRYTITDTYSNKNTDADAID